MLSAPTSQVSPERLMQFTFGFAPPLMIETAIRYGVFDILDTGAKSLDALCAETRTSPRGLRMVLNALVGLDVLSKDDAGHYAFTEQSATFLVTGKPTYHGAFFLLTKEPMLSSWSKLDEVIKTGRSVHHINQEQEGANFFLRFVEDIFPIHYPSSGERSAQSPIGTRAYFGPGFGRWLGRLERGDRTTIAADTSDRSRLA
jgi:hypothetical protein